MAANFFAIGKTQWVDACKLSRLPSPGQTCRTLLPGGCILYRVPLQRWHRNRH